MKSINLLLTLILLLPVLPEATAAIRKASPVTPVAVDRPASSGTVWRQMRMKKRKGWFRSFIKKKVKTEELNVGKVLKILVLIGFVLTYVLVLMIKTIPSPLATAVYVIFFATLFLSLFGLVATKKKDKSRNVFWAVLAHGVVVTLLYLWISSVAD